MGLKSLILSGLMSGMLSFSAGHATDGKVSANYDAFEDKTTITVVGQQKSGQPILYGWDQFKGKKPGSQSIELGFLVQHLCSNPNFLADGQRVQPESSKTIPIRMEVTTNKGRVQSYAFGFNFYDSAQVRQIANARSVKYRVCGQVYVLSPQDQSYLRKFSSYYENNRL